MLVTRTSQNQLPGLPGPQVWIALITLMAGLAWHAPGSLRGEEEAAAAAEVSFYKDIRPIFQANCQGCHQPAKAGGAYVMTEFDRLAKGGESESPAIVPGKPDESYLAQLITVRDGAAEMPKGKPPLSESDVALIRRWIESGAKDDTPEGVKRVYSAEAPPTYTRQPVITAMDYSPDGSLLAVAGFHEVLLAKADGTGIAARLVGMSERIESVAFSPDGKRLLVTGGLPCRMGEVQLWDVDKRELSLSIPVTYDTVYGGSWSPDGKRIAFGGADNSVRAIDAETGKQVLFQGAHSDWVLDTVFSKDGSHLMSVGRDMTCKLTEVATERFVDNVTSITPGVLKGGITTVTRHPERDEIVFGGADGEVKVYRVFRETARKIGDDANLIRRMPQMIGRVFDVAVSSDGLQIAAVSSLDGKGQLHIYSYEFSTETPDDIKKIQSKTVQSRSAAEKAKLDEFQRKNVQKLIDVPFETSLYSVLFSPDGKHVAIAGGDGRIRVLQAADGQPVREFAAAPLTESSGATAGQAVQPPVSIQDTPLGEEPLPQDRQIVALTIEPPSIDLTLGQSTQLLVTAQLDSGDLVDATRIVKFELPAELAEISATGFLATKSAGAGTVAAVWGERRVEAPLNIGAAAGQPISFVRDVAPVLSRLGCNQGTCHGSAKGKNGFKLSLRGYDPLFDVRALTDDLKSRRTNIASPDNSLMLLKATGAAPHVGGQLIRSGEPYFNIIRQWVADGATLDRGAARVASIAVEPSNPIIQRLEGRQQFRVVATFADGARRDVTREAFIESGNSEIASVSRTGVMTALRRGEAPVLARYEGAYAATTLTVMGDRTGFVWKAPETWSKVDELVAEKWRRMKIEPSGLCTDAEFIRRVTLDLTGLPPSADDVRQFLADPRPTREKRDAIVDSLVGSEAYVEFWTNKWADLLQVNRKFLGAEGAAALRAWIRQEVAANTPYDELARKIITANGSNKDNPAAAYYKVLRDPDAIMENTTHLFLAVRFNCNKCHDHPFERWTQDQYYETAAYFARVGLKADPASGKRQIGGTAVEGAKPFYEIVFEKPDGEVKHERTGEIAAPKFPFPSQHETAPDSDRRTQLAAWMTSPDNQYFARSYVNRIWGYMFGKGIIEPIDDIRAGNPATNPELLDYLTADFVAHQFDVQHVFKTVCKSRTYQLSIKTNTWNDDDTLNNSHAVARRLPAEVLYDAIHRVTGSQSKIPGIPPGTRAASIPDAGVELPDGFLTNLGRPVRESACECERASDLQLGPVMALISGPTVGNAIADPENDLPKLVAALQEDAALVDELLVRVINRPATEQEIAAFKEYLASLEQEHQNLQASLGQAEADWKTRRPQLEKQREEAIAAAQAELQRYQAEIAAELQKKEEARVQLIAQREAELKEYRDHMPQNVAAWEAKNASATEWHLLTPQSWSATPDLKLERLEDRSIRATGAAKQGAYTVLIQTRLRNIRGLRIEALTERDEKGALLGPGLPANGNFVVTEVEVQAAPLAKPSEFQKVELQNAKADFLQEGFNAALLADGNAGNQNAWAVHPAGGVSHWATLETKTPLDQEGGMVLKIVIHQNHPAENHLLRRFRIAATGDEGFGLSLPEELAAVTATPADARSPQQQQVLTDYFVKTDDALRGKEAALAEAKAPLPEDPGITSRKAAIVETEQPVVDDPRLVQLRKDAGTSEEQLKTKRLTAAQDLVWALINNPAFLFNR